MAGLDLILAHARHRLDAAQNRMFANSCVRASPSVREWRSMTREELHELVWSQPMRTLAASMGISDVALAKRCRAANVPVPPRGWWARKDAGKPVKIEPLPPLPFAMANYFPALDRASMPDNVADLAERGTQRCLRLRCSAILRRFRPKSAPRSGRSRFLRC